MPFRSFGVAPRMAFGVTARGRLELVVAAFTPVATCGRFCLSVGESLICSFAATCGHSKVGIVFSVAIISLSEPLTRSKVCVAIPSPSGAMATCGRKAGPVADPIESVPTLGIRGIAGRCAGEIGKEGSWRLAVSACSLADAIKGAADIHRLMPAGCVPVYSPAALAVSVVQARSCLKVQARATEGR
jgi:hypothetical protein